MDYRDNLRAPLSTTAVAAFTAGRGSELEDRKKLPAKMRALRSSSAHVVNFFGFWGTRDLSRLLRTLGVEDTGTMLSFEAQLPSGARGYSPHLDALIELNGGGKMGIESTFTEWATPKPDLAGKLRAYVGRTASYFARAGLRAADRLARAVVTGATKFTHLDAPQLLKHTLALARATRSPSENPTPAWALRYVYYDTAGPAHAVHAEELECFSAAVDEELHFAAMTYRNLLAALKVPRGSDEAKYQAYLVDRYFKASGDSVLA